MEIEIVTTKKKVSKALINQMEMAKFNELKHCHVLGYLVNCKKDFHKVLLLKNWETEEYKIMPTEWSKDGAIKIGRGIVKRRPFSDKEWNNYTRLIEFSNGNQVYL